MDVTEFIRKKDVLAYREAFKKRFGVELDEAVAKRELARLVRLVELICKPTSPSAQT